MSALSSQLVPLALASALCACTTALGPRPEDVPTTFDSEAGAMSIVQVEFRATPSGYTLLGVRRSLGEPTLAFDPDGDVLITALSEDGTRLASISVPNPRSAYAADGTEPHEFVLEEGFLSVRLARPESIRQLELTVRKGPNEAFHQIYRID